MIQTKFYPLQLQNYVNLFKYLNSHYINRKRSKMSDRKLWTKQEDILIGYLVGECGTNKWTVVASEMRKHNGGWCRSSKQIRERWNNHLSPHINKSEWQPQEQQIIFECHRIHGNKWKEIAKLLNNRTDNAVKNHFYSTIRRSLRRINKYFGYKNSTSQMRNLKPSVLSHLIESSSNQHSQKIVSIIFKFAQYKPTKNIIQIPTICQIQHHFKAQYDLFLETINHFSQQHDLTKIKKIKKVVFVKQNETECKQDNDDKHVLDDEKDSQEHSTLPQLDVLVNSQLDVLVNESQRMKQQGKQQGKESEEGQQFERQEMAMEQCLQEDYFGEEDKLQFSWFNVHEPEPEEKLPFNIAFSAFEG